MAVVGLRPSDSICGSIIRAGRAIRVSFFDKVSTITASSITRKRTSMTSRLATRGGSRLLVFVPIDLAWKWSVAKTKPMDGIGLKAI